MAVNLSPIWGAGAQLLDNSGNVLSGGKIYTYAAGTTTQVATYTSNSGVTANSNPIVLNSAGRVPYEIWLTDGQNYKFVLKDSNDVLIGTWDNLSGINSNFIAYTNQQEIQTATAGQTIFNLTTMQYLPGTGNLSVFVDGVNQYGPGAQYAFEETDQTTVTFASGLHVGASVKFTSTQIQNSGVADASQIGYTYPATNAVPESVESRLAQYVSVKDFGAVGDGVTDDTVAIQNAIDALQAQGGGKLSFPCAVYKINNEITHYAEITIDLQQSVLDFSDCSDAQAWTIIQTGTHFGLPNGTIIKDCLLNGTLKGVSTPADGVYSATSNGINFAANQISIANVIVQGFKTAFYFNNNAYAISLYNCLAYYNNLGWDATQPGKTNMGAQLFAIASGFAHNEYDVVNNLCESTFTGCYFDSVIYSYVKTNITAGAGFNNGFLKYQDCRFEAGGNASHPWFYNQGYMIMRDIKFFEPATYTYLFENNGGFIVLDRGLSRISGTSLNTNNGKINLFGIKPVDFNGACFQTTVNESNIYNSDFATGTTDGWSVTAGNAVNLTISTDAYTGTYSLQYVASGGVSFTAESWGIPIPTGTKQMLTNLYYKNLNSNINYINLIFYTATGQQIGTESVALQVVSSWTFARFVGYVPTGAAYAKLQLNLPSTETQPVRIDALYSNFS